MQGWTGHKEQVQSSPLGPKLAARTRRVGIDWPLGRRTRLAWWLTRVSSNAVRAKATRAFVSEAARRGRSNTVDSIPELTNNEPGSVNASESSPPERSRVKIE